MADGVDGISVVVPTYRRPDLLVACLEGLRWQERRADEIVVVHRQEDEPTARCLAEIPGLTVVTVTDPGVLAAMIAGVAASTGDVIAFIDDDAVARPDWLAGLIRHLDDDSVGGVGGRDLVHDGNGPATPESDVEVGRITRWGKLIGNHHIGTGPPRDVTVLKAVNMAFRRTALALPRTLRGSGAQVHFEVAVGLWARNSGWRLVYDPSVMVDHYPGPRYDADRRNRPDPVAVRDAAYNLVLCMTSLDPTLRRRRALYGLMVGDAMTPGLLRAGVALVRGDRRVWHRLIPSIAGQLAALRDRARGAHVQMITAPPPPTM
jgi:GT2 family glycosyltransferase